MGSDAACANDKPTLTFDAEKHEYRIDGERVPSVTQVLQGAGLIDTRWFTEETRQRGSCVAQATQFYDEGTLDYDALDDELKPYVMAWERFLVENEVEIEHVELRVCSPTRRFAGTLDREILLKKSRWILDIKTGAKPAWHGLQTAGYASCRVGWYRRAGIILRDDGSYRFIEHSDLNDREVFYAGLNLYHWKAKKGLL